MTLRPTAKKRLLLAILSLFAIFSLASCSTTFADVHSTVTSTYYEDTTAPEFLESIDYSLEDLADSCTSIIIIEVILAIPVAAIYLIFRFLDWKKKKGRKTRKGRHRRPNRKYNSMKSRKTKRSQTSKESTEGDVTEKTARDFDETDGLLYVPEAVVRRKLANKQPVPIFQRKNDFSPVEDEVGMEPHPGRYQKEFLPCRTGVYHQRFENYVSTFINYDVTMQMPDRLPVHTKVLQPNEADNKFTAQDAAKFPMMKAIFEKKTKIRGKSKVARTPKTPVDASAPKSSDVVKNLDKLFGPANKGFYKKIVTEAMTGVQQNISPEDRMEIEKIFQRARELAFSESRVFRFDGPHTVIADLHGQGRDLFRYIADFDRPDSPGYDNIKFCFLGDYVDRGKTGFGLMIFLALLKIHRPDMIIMLRGNHESREVNEANEPKDPNEDESDEEEAEFKFQEELRIRFGPEEGDCYWNLINSFFDCLPPCAVANGRAFYSHGGISQLTPNLSDIEKIPHNIRDPHSCQILLDMVWSDPAFDDDQTELYKFNQGRGAGYCYSERAVNKFLDENHLEIMIRGHEVPQKENGLEFHAGGRCVTLFSATHYNGLSNAGAILLFTEEWKWVLLRFTFLIEEGKKEKRKAKPKDEPKEKPKEKAK